MDENKIYSAEDLLRYAHGQMPAAERHALEKAALDDAFLAEALEGYVETIDNKQQTTGVPELTELRKIIADKTSGKNEKRQAPVIPLFKNKFLQGAVAAMLIFGMAWWFYSISNKSNEKATSTNSNQIAQVQPPPITTDSKMDTVAAKQEQVTILADKTMANEKPLPPQAEAATSVIKKDETIKKTQSAPTTASLVMADSLLALKDVALSKNEIAEKRSQIQPVESSKKVVAKDMVAGYGTLQKPSQTIESLTIPKKTTFVFKGRMVDANNNPLPFSSVIVPREEFGTYTDEQGYFNFVYTDSMLLVHAKSLGFEQQDYNMLASKKENKIVLNEDKNLDKSLTFLHFAKGRKSSTYKPTIIKVDSISSTVEPFVGWKNYDLYLANNNRISDFQSLNNRTVLLSFEVGQDGDIKNITVDKSQGKDLDAEAIRLLKEGPKWKVKKMGEKGKVEVKF